MKRARRRGPGPSHLLMTPDHAGNVVGVDPHKRTLTATVADARGGILASAHFRVSGEGHRELEAWARQFGQIARWGIEGSASWGRHTAVFVTGRGHDVRDVRANRTPRSDRARQRGKSDMLDSERIAREVLAHPLLPQAFKRSGAGQGPDEDHPINHHVADPEAPRIVDRDKAGRPRAPHPSPRPRPRTTQPSSSSTIEPRIALDKRRLHR